MGAMSGISIASLSIRSIVCCNKCDGVGRQSHAMELKKPRLVKWLDNADRTLSSDSIVNSFLVHATTTVSTSVTQHEQACQDSTLMSRENSNAHTSPSYELDVDTTDPRKLESFNEVKLALRCLRPGESAAPVLERFRETLTGDKDIGSWLVIHLSRAGRRKTSVQVLEWLSDRKRCVNLNAYNSVITCLVRNNEEEDAVSVYDRMQTDKVQPTLYTYTAVIRAVSHVQGWEAAHRMYSELVINGSLKPDVVMYNNMLAAYGRGHKLERVLQTWERMRVEKCHENVGTYCLLVSTFVQLNQTDLALQAYAQMMKQGLKATDGIYRGMVCVCANQGRWLLALSFFKEMLQSGCKPTIITYNVLLRSLGKAGKWEIVLDLLPRMKMSGINPDYYTVNAVLNGLITASQFDRAMQFFNSIKDSGLKLDREVYNVILVVCQRTNNWEEALLLIKEMQDKGITPNEVTFGPLLMACENTRQVDVALKVYDHMKQRRCIPNTHVVASLIRTCGRELMWEEARKIYEDFRKAGQKPNVYVYNALIDAYCRSKKYYLAKMVNDTMTLEGCQPNNVTKLLLGKFKRQEG